MDRRRPSYAMCRGMSLEWTTALEESVNCVDQHPLPVVLSPAYPPRESDGVRLAHTPIAAQASMPSQLAHVVRGYANRAGAKRENRGLSVECARKNGVEHDDLLQALTDLLDQLIILNDLTSNPVECNRNE